MKVPRKARRAHLSRLKPRTQRLRWTKLLSPRSMPVTGVRASASRIVYPARLLQSNHPKSQSKNNQMDRSRKRISRCHRWISALVKQNHQWWMCQVMLRLWGKNQWHRLTSMKIRWTVNWKSTRAAFVMNQSCRNVSPHRTLSAPCQTTGQCHDHIVTVWSSKIGLARSIQSLLSKKMPRSSVLSVTDSLEPWITIAVVGLSWRAGCKRHSHNKGHLSFRKACLKTKKIATTIWASLPIPRHL